MESPTGFGLRYPDGFAFDSGDLQTQVHKDRSGETPQETKSVAEKQPMIATSILSQQASNGHSIQSKPSRASFDAKDDRRRARHIISAWGMEIGACVLLLVALLAIVVTIRPHQGKPLPEWPFRISVNSLLAIYGSVVKATAIYIVGSSIAQFQWLWFTSNRPLNDVSRFAAISHGDLVGAFGWLSSNKCSSPLVAFGSLIIIASVAIDPFIQQLTSYVDCSVSLGGADATTTLPRTSYGQVSIIVPELAQDFNVPPWLDPQMIEAVYSGLTGSPIALTAAGCTTGNCSFSTPYATIGICSTCEDISDTITITRVCLSWGNGNFFSANVTDCANATEQGRLWATRVSTLPSGTRMEWSPVLIDQTVIVLNTSGTIDADGTNLASFDILVGETVYSAARVNPATLAPITGCDDTATNDTWVCRGYGAAHCVLTPCVKAYQQASVSAGVLTEEAVEDSSGFFPIWPLRNGTSLTVSIVDLECVNNDELEGLRGLGYNSTPSSPRWITYEPPFNQALAYGPDAPFPESLTGHGCLYVAEDSLYSFIQTGIDRSLVGDVVFTIREYNAAGPVIVPLENGLDTNATGLEILYNNSDVNFASISTVFSQIADYYTARLRQNGQANHSTPVTGTIQHYAICLDSSWAWLALPAAVSMCALVLMLVTIVVTARGGSPLWKAEALALVFHGPGAAWLGFGQQDAAYWDTIEGMRRVAAEQTVCLNKKRGKWVELGMTSKD
jgi:hypothetical protein